MNKTTTVPSVQQLCRQHKSLVKGAGGDVLGIVDEVFGVFRYTPKAIVQMGRGRILVLLPESGPSSKGIRIQNVLMLAMGLVRIGDQLQYAVQQDYDLWKDPQSGTRDSLRLDPRWPLNQPGKKSHGRGDVLEDAITLFSHMAEVCREESARAKTLKLIEVNGQVGVASEGETVFGKLDVVPTLPTIMVGTREEPQLGKLSARWSATMTQDEASKRFFNNVLPPDMELNPSGMWLSPAGAYNELPNGPLWESYLDMPESQTILRTASMDELVFEPSTNDSNIRLDLTQRRFAPAPTKTNVLNLGGASLQPASLSEVAELAEANS